MVKGDNVFSKLKYESGTHRVQRIPETESNGRIHTSTATVAVLAEMKDVEIDINPSDLKIDVYRSGGAGGQSVNTADSAVRITHLPTGVVVTCQNERSQQQNKAKAMEILKSKLYEEELRKREEEYGNDRKIKIGNKNFAGEQTVNEDKTGTNLYLNVDGKTVGSIILSDEIKPDAKTAIDKLNKLGIITKMFTGDSKEIALEIAKQVGIAKVEYEMLPQDKYSKLEEEIKFRGFGCKTITTR